MSSSKVYSRAKRELKVLNVLDGKASPETRSLFNKNFMLAPCVTPGSIHCSVLSTCFDCCCCF